MMAVANDEYDHAQEEHKHDEGDNHCEEQVGAALKSLARP
jgi:hypothetical protein